MYVGLSLFRFSFTSCFLPLLNKQTNKQSTRTQFLKEYIFINCFSSPRAMFLSFILALHIFSFLANVCSLLPHIHTNHGGTACRFPSVLSSEAELKFRNKSFDAFGISVLGTH